MSRGLQWALELKNCSSTVFSGLSVENQNLAEGSGIRLDSAGTVLFPTLIMWGV
jgi:hypothetical protein